MKIRRSAHICFALLLLGGLIGACAPLGGFSTGGASGGGMPANGHGVNSLRAAWGGGADAAAASHPGCFVAPSGRDAAQFGDSDRAHWFGVCIGGVPHGPGVLVRYRGEREQSRESGTMRAGAFEGEVVATSPGGAVIVGQYRAGRRDGDFLVIEPSGQTWRARYDNGAQRGIAQESATGGSATGGSTRPAHTAASPAWLGTEEFHAPLRAPKADQMGGNIGRVMCSRIGLYQNRSRWCGVVIGETHGDYVLRVSLVEPNGFAVFAIARSACTGGALLTIWSKGKEISVPKTCVVPEPGTHQFTRSNR